MQQLELVQSATLPPAKVTTPTMTKANPRRNNVGKLKRLPYARGGPPVVHVCDMPQCLKSVYG
ncbi:hypothetical protein IQ266_18830 [filamentous cyanobacterium LEGE 11480]|uniref:Uncharacterized protein n=1 Tax=Romeriopsis navalis LEGE 11480 TaxID=2777977 RepID=A0A928VQ83_9CYAN|nr:hypothetical protein [Romeriopsis navalis]MBE9031793.1 hypothetical protein [Romeriopsis navalis LEGE 11480]